jgi:homocysteine S-methyltransferase
MSKYRAKLPQLGGALFLTDGGLETTLVFLKGMELPYFAAFDLMRSPEGRATLRDYFETYIGIARAGGYGFILEAPTWRASPDWGRKLGYSREELAAINRDSIALLEALRAKFETDSLPMVVSGCVGPRGDGYDPGQVMTAEKAQTYDAEQIGALGSGPINGIPFSHEQ